MKKLLLCLLGFITLQINAQTNVYHPLLDSVNNWSFIINVMPIIPPSARSNCSYPFFGQKMNTGSDTVINTKNYKKMYQDFNSCTFGFIREDTSLRRVYFIDNNFNPETVLYDFKMQINDTIPIHFNSIGIGCYWQDGTYTLDSIDSVNTMQGYRKIFYLNCPSCLSSNTLSWIEGIGSLENPVYTYGENGTWGFGDPLFYSSGCSQFPHTLTNFMICFEHNQKVFFDSCAYQTALMNSCFAVSDSCDYGNTCGNISQLDFSSSVSVFPNPFNASAVLKINGSFNSTYKIIIVDTYGRTIYDGYIYNQEIILSRKYLSDGLYFYRITGKNGKFAGGKFIVN